jgi:hypothetical protein
MKMTGTKLVWDINLVSGTVQKIWTNGYRKETWLLLLANLYTLENKNLFTLLKLPMLHLPFCQ